ncbi:MAG: hypothetical protein IJ381_02640 [Clostridia bacterium]|nr:hypothetical protein [Clostridia bacterium]
MKNNMKMNSGISRAASRCASAGDTLLMVVMVSFAPVMLVAMMMLSELF